MIRALGGARTLADGIAPVVDRREPFTGESKAAQELGALIKVMDRLSTTIKTLDVPMDTEGS